MPDDDDTVLRHETLATYADIAPGEHLWWVDHDGIRHEAFNGWPYVATLALIRRDAERYRRVEPQEVK